MKKLLVIFLALAMVFALAACGGGDEPAPPEGDAPAEQQPAEQPDEQPAEQPDDPGSAPEGPADQDISGWAKTKTGKFYSQFADEMYMEYEMEAEGMVMTVVSATKGDKVYSESTVDGQAMGVTIMDGEDLYMIDHASKMVIKMSSQINEGAIDTMLEEEDVDLGTMISGQREVDGKTYDAEEWIVDDGASTTLCFDGDKLVYMIGQYEGEEVIMKILKTSDKVDASLFELPADYEMMSY